MKYKIKISCEKTNKNGNVLTFSEEVERSLLNLAFDEAEELLMDLRQLAESEKEKENNIIEE